MVSTTVLITGVFTCDLPIDFKSVVQITVLYFSFSYLFSDHYPDRTTDQ